MRLNRNLRILPWTAIFAVRLLAFDPAKDVGFQFHQGHLRIEIPAGAHLKVRAFKVALLSTPGQLSLGTLPPASGKDETDDPIWRGTVDVPLRGESIGDPVELRITFQPCTEGEAGVCFLPQRRVVAARAADFIASRD